MKSERKTWLLW